MFLDYFVLIRHINLIKSSNHKSHVRNVVIIISTTNFPVFSLHTCGMYGLHTRKEIHNSDLTGPLFLLPEDNRLRKHFESVSHEWLLFLG